MRNLIRLSLVPALFVAGGWSALSAQTVTVDKSTLNFSAQFQGAVASQQLTVSSSSGAVPFSIFTNTSGSVQWLKVNGQTVFTGTTPVAVTATADPTGLNPGTYTSTLSVVSSGNTIPVSVTFTVSTIGVSPSSITFTPYTVGGSLPLPQSVTLSGTGSFTAAASTTTGGQWLSVTPTSSAAPGAVTVSLNASIVTGLSTGTYQGAITITPAGSNSPIIVPVTLTVVPTPPVSVNPASVVFNVQQGGTNNIATQTLTIYTTPGQSQNFGFQASVSSGTNWITISPASGTTNPATGQAQVTIGYNLSGLVVGTAYTGSITLFTPGATPVQTSIPVTLNYSTSPLLNVPTNTLPFFYEVGGGALPPDQTVAVTATSGSQSYSIGQSANSSWLVVPNAGNTGTPFTVHVNPAGLAPGTYNATINITSQVPGSTPQQIPVFLVVSNDPFLNSNVNAMAFPVQIGQQAPAAQALRLTSSSGATLNFTVTPSTTNCGNGWLLLNGAPNALSGSTDAGIVVSIATSGLTAGTCTGAINITSTVASTGVATVNSPLSIPITVTVASTPMLVTTPASLSFVAPANGQSPAPQTIALSSTSGTDILSYTITSVTGTSNGVTWLFAGPTTGTTASGNMITVTVFSGTLPAGTYTGSVTLAAALGSSAVANSPVTIPVTLQVTSGSLTLSATSLNFAYTIGAASPAKQTVTIGSSTSTGLVYTAVANSSATNPWLSVTPTSGNTASNGTLTASVDGTKFTSPGTYNGTITVTSPGAGNSPAVINVTTTVSAGTISAPTTTLSFVQASGGAAPAAQTIAVTGTPAALAFTVTASTTPAGGSWLSATPASGNTPGNVSVSVNAGTLGVGQYSGQIVITSAGANGSPITVPIVLNVVTPTTATVAPTSLSFTYVVGQAVPAAQTLTVTSPSAIPINAAVTVAGSVGTWLTVTPMTSNAPASLSVAVQPQNLTASTTPYTGTITITSPNLSTSLTVPVSLTVTNIPKPVISAIGNAGSYATGPVAPGENVVIFGTGVGPSTLVVNSPANNAFGTIIGNTRVLFDGVAAPILYASATQTSVMVPYGVFGRTSTSIVVEYFGVQSNPTSFNVVGSAPGIYTQNQAGTGPGAILNQDGFTVNGPNAPEKRGNVVSVYMTGEGQTSPAGVDGAIIPPILSALKMPVLPVTATIGGQTATVAYAGSAAGQISGLMQVNVVIPANAPVGNSVPIVITVGTVASQASVTVAIQ
jgi:uncharacterized protein (TIGR03437 family)